jgi:hypothetical protein
LLRELIVKVADVVRARFLTAPRPVAAPESPKRRCRRTERCSPEGDDYAPVQSELVALNRTGKLNDSMVNRFAVRGEYTHVVAALALKADVKVEAIEPLLEPDRVYGLIVACKAARLTWSTTTMIVRNRPNCPPSTDRELEQCVAVFESCCCRSRNGPSDGAPIGFWQKRTSRRRLRRRPAENRAGPPDGGFAGARNPPAS